MNRKRFLVDRAGNLRTTSKARRRTHLQWLEAPEGLEQRIAMTGGPDLGVGVTVQSANYTVGQTVTYTITVQNGASADPILLNLPITMTDLAALGLSNVTASAASGWSFTNTSSTSPSLITGTYTGAYPVAAGATLPAITVTGTANGAVLGLVLNTSTVSVLGDLNLANNSASVDIGVANALTTSQLTVNPSTGSYGGTTSVSATLATLGLLPEPNETVDFHLGATDLGTATTNALGVATLSGVSLGAINAGLLTNDITASFAGDSVYASASGTANLTVTPAPLTVTAAPTTKVYGQANPTFTATTSGFVLGQNSSVLGGSLSFSTPATASSHVGIFAVTPSGLTSSNYSISYVPGNLSVTAAPLTITANNQSKLYGAALPTLTASYTGLVNGDTSANLTIRPTLTTTASAISHVAGSPYSITASGALDTDYTISYVAGTLSVTAAPLTITANNQTKAYASALPTLTASYTGLVNGDTAASLITPAIMSTVATSASHVAGSPYAITASGAVDPDYSISYVPGSLSVTAVPLTITADSQSTVYGAALPTLTASYTGLVNGDTAASLTTPAIVTTTATSASHVLGSPYAITVSGATDPDYTISYAPGSLSVAPSTLTITADNQAKVYGAALPTLTASYSGFVNGDTSASLTTPPSLLTTATAASHVLGAPYSITASGAVDPDYSINYVPGSLSVTAAPLTITANSQSKVYGGAVPTLTASYTGLVNGDTSASLTTPATLSSTVAPTSHVGSYPIVVAGGFSSDYTITNMNGSFSVTPAPLTVTPTSFTKGYGVALPTLTANYSGFVNGDTTASLTSPVVLSTTGKAVSLPGSFAITASGGTSPDYTLNYGQGTMSVTVTASQAAEIAFVSTLYQDILHRAPDLSGLASFVADLDLGRTKLSVTQQIYASTEAAAIRTAGGTATSPLAPQEIDLIIALYMDVLGRAPEPSGVDSFLVKFAGGESAAQVASEVQNSAEAIADHANPPTPGYGIPTDLVNALYLNMLGRPVDGPGLTSWLSKLSGGENAAQVAQEIYNSTEAMSFRSASDFVSILYTDVLHRAPDPNGLSSFVTELNSGVSKLAVTQTIYNSSEAAAVRSAAGVSAAALGPQEVDMVIALYRDVLGRAPEPSGLASFLAKIAAGETAPQVASEIQNSAEAIADRANPPTPGFGVPTDLVEALYEDILGRAADGPGLNSWLTKLSNGETAAQVAQDIYNTPEAVTHRHG